MVDLAPALDELDGYATVITRPELDELLAFVRTATPVIEELNEHMPALRALAAMGAQMAKGGPTAILGLLRGT